MIDVIMVFSIAKMFQNNSFSKKKQLFFPVTLLKRNSNVILKLYMLTVYVFGKGINV